MLIAASLPAPISLPWLIRASSVAVGSSTRIPSSPRSAVVVCPTLTIVQPRPSQIAAEPLGGDQVVDVVAPRPLQSPEQFAER